MDLPRDFHGTSMGFPWDVHKPFMGLHSFHKISTEFMMDFYGTPVVGLPYVGLPQDFHG